jgi:demethylmenaquinone methyltransferase/2-methoxy-6-polyprenyl-1,4-benzoquinol methylase
MSTKRVLILASITIAILALFIPYFRYNPPSAQISFGSGEMFDSIATYYDQGNEYLSLGLHKSWKANLLYELKLSPETKLLDLATGTADVAIMAASSYGAEVIGLDPSDEMLAIGRKKAKDLNLNVHLMSGDAQDLNRFDKESFDRVSISFGIRNVPDRLKALKESWKVLKNGGILGILELTPPDESYIISLAVKNLVPVIGWIVSGRSAEYAYLERSIFNFPNSFETTVEEAGFTVVKVKSFMGGLVKLFVAQKYK